MSFRGRGRGRGFGGGFRPGKQVSWDPFPEIEGLGTADGYVERLALAKWYSKLHSYWRASPYYYEGDKETTKGAKGEEIERFSDMVTSKTKAKPPLSHFIRMEQEYVPAELARGEKKRPTKQVRWNPDSGLDKLDLFEKLEHKYEDNEKKEGEDEEDDDEPADEEEAEYSDDGDYNQNIDFDDDDDGFNMADDNDDEPYF